MVRITRLKNQLFSKSFSVADKVLEKIFFVSSLVLFTYVFFFNAWVCDDAYITFRTVDNFTSGHGLVWNPGERVQAYTHPLWMFLISLFYYFTSEVYYTSIFISFFLCLFSIFVVWYSLRYEPTWKRYLFLLLIISSKAFVDYSSSGLENPLSFLLISVFYTFVFVKVQKLDEITNNDLFLIFFVASLAFINRQDSILLYLPTLIYLIFFTAKKLNSKLFITVVLAISPALFWLLFSLIYYGFFFPNTAYAKLSHGISQVLLLKQGLIYCFFTIFSDPATFLIIFITVLIIFLQKRSPLYLTSGFGIVLYLLYILKIGGDHFVGRFFSIPFFLSCFLLIKLIKNKKVALAISTITILIIILNPVTPVKSSFDYKFIPGVSGIADSRGWYYPGTGFLNHLLHGKIKHRWHMWGKVFREQEKMVVVFPAIGFFGFNAGSAKYIIDPLGLSDPLLAHLPAEEKENFWIGHYKRKLPHGYITSIKCWETLLKTRSYMFIMIR